MFRIYDGRTDLYQWDLDRKLIVGDKTIREVHFCNRTGECSLIRNVYEVNGMYLVDIPNILLQTDWDIRVYGIDSNYTKHNQRFNVIARTRPENYVYTGRTAPYDRKKARAGKYAVRHGGSYLFCLGLHGVFY